MVAKELQRPAAVEILPRRRQHIREPVIDRRDRPSLALERANLPRTHGRFVAAAKPAAVDVEDERRRRLRFGQIQIDLVPFMRTIRNIGMRRLDGLAAAALSVSLP